MNDNEIHARIGEYITSHPSETYAQIGTTLGLGRSQVARIARLQGVTRRPGKRASLEAALAAIEAATPPTEGTICAAPDASPVEDILSTAPGTPSAETAAV
jgi:hypothetical protein